MPAVKVTLQDRQRDFNSETVIENNKLMCRACHKQLDWQKRSTVTDHLKTDYHTQRVQKAEQEKTKQITIPQLLESSQKRDDARTTVILDAVRAFTAVGCPLLRLAHCAMRRFMEKYIPITIPFPMVDALRRNYLQKVFSNHKTMVKECMAKSHAVSIVADETPDFLSRKILNIIATTFDADTNSSSNNNNKNSATVYLLNCIKLNAVNYKTVGDSILENLRDYDIPYSKVNAFVTDNASYMRKAYTDILQHQLYNSQHITCMAHIYDLAVQSFIDELPIVNAFVVAFKMAFSRNTSERKFRFRQLMIANNMPEQMPPEPETNRWCSWLDAVIYHNKRIHLYIEFFTEENDSKCVKDLINLLHDEQLKIDVADAALVGEYLNGCIERNEGLNANSHEIVSEISNVTSWCTTTPVSLSDAECCTAAGIKAFKSTVQRYFMNDDDITNRFKQPATKFFRAVRFLDPTVVKSFSFEQEYMFKNIRRFEGEELSLSAQLKLYFDQVRSNEIVIKPKEHAMDFWRRTSKFFPELSQAALFCLATVSNSVSAERSFSKYRCVMVPRRSSLSESNIAVYNILYHNNDEDMLENEE